MRPPKAAPNQARLRVVPETALEMGSELGSGAFGTVYKVQSTIIPLLTYKFIIIQGYWQPEGDAHKYTVAIKVMKEDTSAQCQTELLQVGVFISQLSVCNYLLYIAGRSYYGLH